MSKIQILNETQVQHFYSLIEPKLAKQFDVLLKVKEDEVKANEVNFLTHKDVLEIKTKRAEELNRIEKVAEISTTLKELKIPGLILADVRYSGEYYKLAESYLEDKTKFLEDFNKETERRVNDKKHTLSYTDLNMSKYHSKRWEIQSLLKAKLCMVAVTDADTIENKMLQEINVESFFTI